MIIEINEKKIELDFEEELKVKHLRKLQPILTKYSGWGAEVEMVMEIVKAFCTDSNIESIVDDLNIQEFTELSEKITEILSQTEKKNK